MKTILILNGKKLWSHHSFEITNNDPQLITESEASQITARFNKIAKEHKPNGNIIYCYSLLFMICFIGFIVSLVTTASIPSLLILLGILCIISATGIYQYLTMSRLYNELDHYSHSLARQVLARSWQVQVTRSITIFSLGYTVTIYEDDQSEEVIDLILL
jgi:hypothetical protein